MKVSERYSRTCITISEEPNWVHFIMEIWMTTHNPFLFAGESKDYRLLPRAATRVFLPSPCYYCSRRHYVIMNNANWGQVNKRGFIHLSMCLVFSWQPKRNEERNYAEYFLRFWHEGTLDIIQAKTSWSVVRYQYIIPSYYRSSPLLHSCLGINRRNCAKICQFP